MSASTYKEDIDSTTLQYLKASQQSFSIHGKYELRKRLYAIYLLVTFVHVVVEKFQILENQSDQTRQQLAKSISLQLFQDQGYNSYQNIFQQLKYMKKVKGVKQEFGLFSYWNLFKHYFELNRESNVAKKYLALFCNYIIQQYIEYPTYVNYWRKITFYTLYMYRSAYKTSESKRNDLRNKIEDLKNQIDQQLREKERLQIMVNDYESQMNELRQEHKLQFEAMSTEYQNREKEINEKWEKIIKSYNDHQNALESENKVIKEANQGLLMQIEELRQTYEKEKKSLLDSLENMKGMQTNRIAELKARHQSEIDALMAEMKANKNLMDQREKELQTDYTNRLKALNLELQDVKARSEKERKQNAQKLQNNINTLNEENQQRLRELKAEHKQALESLQYRYDQAMKQHNQVMEESEQALLQSNQLRERERKQEELEYQQRIQRLKSDYKQVQERNEQKLRNEMEDIKEREFDALRAKFVKEKRKKQQEFELQFNNLNAQYQQEKQRYEADQKNAQQELKRVHDQLNKFKNDNALQAQNLLEANMNLQTLRKSHAMLSNHISELEKKQKVEIQNLKNDFKSKFQRLTDRFKNHVANIKKSNVTNRKALEKKLREKYLSIVEQINTTFKGRKEKLKQVYQNELTQFKSRLNQQALELKKQKNLHEQVHQQHKDQIQELRISMEAKFDREAVEAKNSFDQQVENQMQYYSNEKHQWEQRVNSLREENNKLQKLIRKHDEGNAVESATLSELQHAHAQKIENMMKQFEFDMKGLQASFHLTESKLKERLQKCEENVSILKRTLITCQRKYDNVKNDMYNLTTRAKELETNLNKCEQDMNEMKQRFENELKKCRDIISNQRNLVQQWEESIETKSKAIDDYEYEIRTLENQLNFANRDKQRFKEDLNETKEELKISKQQKQELFKNVNKLGDEYNSKLARYKEITEANLSDCARDIKHLNSRITQLNARLQNSPSEDDVLDLQNELSQTKESMNNLQVDVKRLKRREQSLLNQLQKAQNQIDLCAQKGMELAEQLEYYTRNDQS